MKRKKVLSDNPWVNRFDPDIEGIFHKSYFSESMDREIGYAIYIPSGYANYEKKEYPVIYWLHGKGGDGDSRESALTSQTV